MTEINKEMIDTEPSELAGASLVSPQVTHKHLHSTKLNIIIILLVVIFCIGGFLFYRQRSGGPTKPDYKKYSGLSSYKIKGDANGSGMSFALPADFSKLSNLPNSQSKDSSFLEHSSNDKYLTIGGAYAISIAYPNKTKLPDSQIKDFTDRLTQKKPDLTFIRGQISSAQIIIEPNFTKQTVTVKSVKSFKTTNIKSGAWIADFIVYTGASSKLKPIYQGELVNVLGKNANYHLLVYSANYNWSPNAQVWQQAFNSLKIDQ